MERPHLLMSTAGLAYKILTWGCQMNEDDSIQMANLLEQMGCVEAAEERDADIILLNTCSVREKPEQKVRSKLGEFRALKEAKPSLIVGVCGCMAQREGKNLLKHGAPVDLVIGTACIHELPGLIEHALKSKRRVVADNMPEGWENNGSAESVRAVRPAGKVGIKAFVPVMYGCNNHCTYCVVPSARGPERSRPVEAILAEIKRLVAAGCRQVTLVGQNVNSYAGTCGKAADDTATFAELLTMINDVKGLLRIRFTTSHPKDMNENLIRALEELPKVCEHLHLPIQSGDDEILDRMGRGYTAAHYLDLLERLRTRMPEIAVTTDIMVGFPGETHEQFLNSLELMNEVKYDAAFMFAFNPRPGTPAAKMDCQVEQKVKTLRLIELIAVQNAITLEKNKEELGTIFEILVEGPSEKDPDMLTGYTRSNKTMNFPGKKALIGKLALVTAVKAHPWGFTGELAEGVSD